jgi:formamidopyrimidine-DNA glycosylase
MPELPEVETVARDLRPRVVGARITGTRTNWLKTLRSGDSAAFAAAVVGRSIVEATRRAKLVVLELDDGQAITIHLKMTGQLFVVPATSAEDPYVRAVIAFDDGRELRFRDIRKFGRIGIASRDAASGDLVGELGGPKTFKGFGPEPLESVFTLARFRRLIRGRRGRLKSLLMDQAFLAGVGNIYADEALWAAKLHPLRTAQTLRPADERHLYVELRRLLAEAVERRGSSIDDYTAPDGDGSMQEHLAVYGRTGEPCERCGRPIRRFFLGGRGTHFCSWCQRLPPADRAAAAALLRTVTPRPGAAARGRRASTPGARAAASRKAAATRRAAARAGTA